MVMMLQGDSEISLKIWNISNLPFMMLVPQCEFPLEPFSFVRNQKYSTVSSVAGKIQLIQLMKFI